MRDYLVFQLYAPLAAWGDIAVGETRPSGFAPAKSAVLGLIAAALGLRRPDTTRNEDERRQWEAEHAALGEGYGMAAKLTQPGLPLTDYHTAQVPSSGSGRNKKVFATRRDELTWMPRHDLNTILSRRDYRQDAYAVVALWARHRAPYPLAELRNKLLEPGFVLYLGRKSCPPALPLDPSIVSSASIEDALARLSFGNAARQIWSANQQAAEWISKRMDEANPLLLWDADAETRLSAEQTVTRRDAPASRRRWQFTVREERRAHLPSGDQT
ncbi:MAG: type I-E CRISPR-associated protein Cas5/CasD [Pseudomonadota bacterium]|nr:type I-E CRISPR-associated protein Cas5/CasD [Pseudomonadota bacterium]